MQDGDGLELSWARIKVGFGAASASATPSGCQDSGQCKKTTSYRMSVAPWDCFKGFECALKVLKILHTNITTDTLTD